MKSKFILFIVLFVGAFHPIFAQDLLKLDLQGARQQAIQYNKVLKNSGLAIEKAQEQYREAIAAGLPQVSAAADYSNALGAKISIRFNPDMPATEIPIKPQSNFKLQVGQLLFNANYIVGLELARLGTQLSEKSYEKTEQEILSQVTAGYYLVQVSGELLNLMNKNVDNLKEVYRKTDAMVNVGILEQTDLDQLSVQLSALENGVTTSKRQLELAKNMLRMQIGLTFDTEFELTENLAQVLAHTQGSYLANESFDVRNNLDYQLIDFQERLADKQVKMKNASYLPTLSGFYSRTEKILKPDFDMSPKNMLGLQLNIPIFSGGSKTAQVKQARIDLESMRNTRSLLDEQLRIQERQLQFNLKNAREAYLNQVKNLDVARRVYANLKLKFEHGLISGLDIVTADNNYVRAETDYISSVYQVLQATVELDKINGILK